MKRLGERRQVLLFLAAVCAPSLALVVLTVRLLERDRELAGKRLDDQRRQAVLRIADSLFDRLAALRRDEAERLSGRASGPPAAAVALTAPVRDGRLALPWELERPAVANAVIRTGERQELEQGMLEEAARTYERALAGGLNPAQAGYAKLLRARVLYKLDRREQAISAFQALLKTPVELRDDDGIPLALRAADLMVDAGADPGGAVAAARSTLAMRWPSPEASYLAARLAGRLGDKALEADVQRRIRLIEQAQSLQDEYPRLRLSAAAWLPYPGEELWLVSAIDAPPAVVAVVAAKALDGVRFLTARDSGSGEWLGEAFPGLRAAMPAPGPQPSSRDRLQEQLYYAAVLLVAGSTIFGSYLLWRDMRREMRLAEMRAQFVSNVSHELKTPLTAIRMFAETLQMGRSADREEYLGTIVNECERLSRLVDDVLQFSRIEQGRKTYHFARTDIADVVDAAARAIQYPLSRHGFNLDVALAEDLPPARLDRDAIEQAILNLLGNAMKYSGDARSIELRLRREDGRAAIDVTDRGIGIPTEEQSRIFEKFYRAPTRENQLISGTGLGLALVQQIVAAHGGDVRVRSRPGEGSTFTILLPLEETL